jgi:hypothetical protein
MGRKFNPFEKELYQRTDEVLHYVWDPIRVAGIPLARDEYDSYLPQIFSMLIERKGEDEIAEYLTGIEDNRMGLTPGPEKTSQVASILTDWCETLREKYEPTT